MRKNFGLPAWAFRLVMIVLGVAFMIVTTLVLRPVRADAICPTSESCSTYVHQQLHRWHKGAKFHSSGYKLKPKLVDKLDRKYRHWRANHKSAPALKEGHWFDPFLRPVHCATAVALGGRCGPPVTSTNPGVKTLEDTLNGLVVNSAKYAVICGGTGVIVGIREVSEEGQVFFSPIAIGSGAAACMYEQFWGQDWLV